MEYEVNKERWGFFRPKRRWEKGFRLERSELVKHFGEPEQFDWHRRDYPLGERWRITFADGATCGITSSSSENQWCLKASSHEALKRVGAIVGVPVETCIGRKPGYYDFYPEPLPLPVKIYWFFRERWNHFLYAREEARRPKETEESDGEIPF